MTSLGESVRTRRRDLHLGQEELAELADVSERFVREVERDKPTVRLDKLTSLLDALGLELRVEIRGS
ncbi:type II toxin-antitoxin system Y4mF family antitoxin [Luteipulveratus mongoliensis]|uniref:Transcriptional regulator, y4mF family protein n=1 Tax=Luteipulveratus mongoliensis TaxID=571913 RepID=A0A0K1JDR8_9MICO|nr:type II toxin-antitoxin system Y4mF family antitoxin [Luteipulveratus mongoliensis]AKU14862.1 transcriptional regulator, y4mF family protein [Luteipulveratus mongoliensis]